MTAFLIKTFLKHLIVSIVAVAGITSTSVADTPPHVVYIFTASPPETIFDNGFIAKGTDHDFIRFISGVSVADGTSAYLVLNDSLERTLAAARVRLIQRPDVAYYLYAVRPSNSFYNVMTSLLYARSVLPDGDTRQRVSVMLVGMRPYDIWAARDYVSGSQVYRARRLYLNDGRVTLGTVISNPLYLFGRPEVSPHPMPIRNRSDDTVLMGEQAHQVGFVLLGMDRMGCGAQRPHFKVARGDRCTSAEKLSFAALHTEIVSKLIALNVL
ncbi:hypothetical protein CGLAMM_00025 [Acetobacteraceae bacterium EV16G]|uniref:Uncharacterized protein n=1 Tax=Sorlinia euscelidii TaxID=3081148 RepID=A0ABU7U3J8_9PROT